MMKKKWMAPVLALLLCVSMVGIGFAAWIITAPAEESANGQFEVYDVTDNSIDMTVSMTDNTVKFGSKTFTTDPKGTPADASDDVTNHNWLSLSDADSVEDLSATMTIKINNYSALSAKKIQITLSSVQIKKAEVNVTEQYANYITVPVAHTITLENGAVDTTSQGLGITFSGDTITVPLTFAWGSYFDGTNPNQYFNQVAANTNLPDAHPAKATYATYKDLANGALGSLYDIYNDQTVRYTINVSAAVAN